ncbi:MAG: hypothetical protein IT160_20500 [Bryobacterales bacterium]|nr:hypothetical protein [Bryobacterales bacterium]
MAITPGAGASVSVVCSGTASHLPISIWTVPLVPRNSMSAPHKFPGATVASY